MSEQNRPQSQAESGSSPTHWTSLQAYLLAAFCLLLGVALGYLFHGSASPAAQAAAPTTQQPEMSAPNQNASAQNTPTQTPPTQQNAQAEAALAQAVAPFEGAVKKNPNDYDALVQLGNLYYDARQYPSAIQDYERALKIHPENADVRTDMGTAYWYAGNVDKALTEMQTSLKYRPGHPQTLFNLGWIRWQGKADPKGAVQAWEELLKDNPTYPQREQVEQNIAKAKEHAARG
ncbi:MAG: tetratricopeptide repeat protein [Candidatus Sulfotelmatobacter sp.]